MDDVAVPGQVDDQITDQMPDERVVQYARAWRGGVDVETMYEDAPMHSLLRMAQTVARADSIPKEDETIESLMAFRRYYTTITRQIIREDNRQQHKDAQ
ncbi:hypothetical protein BUALT_Bualt04G0003900 [Buddleja alternifolia]|uniref:Uncharacterized protein n=1 Tax=Buddleja alternifolia TaxID=168488 RepID=A0AAV6XS06_9LAMI|nr:hypothetical protein BUALT_Bualt04G0003900 [Buddleja alternifolia]